jgi:hypothetical protein
MKMKALKYISGTLIPFLLMGCLVTMSCEEDGNGLELETPDGPPVVHYIRVTDPDASDSLLVSSELGGGIAIVGKNLGGTREIWFNDMQAILTPTLVTNRTILVNVPSVAPSTVTNIMYLVDAAGNVLEHPFVVAIPAPELHSVKNEWPQPNEHLIINGDYFFEPVTVTFTGGITGEVVSVSQTQVEVEVPAGATAGPIVLATNFGEATSSFHIWDSRNVILNFDDKRANGWRIGLVETGDDEIDGNYLVVRGNIAANQRDEGPGAPAQSPLTMEYWGGSDATRDGNFYPLYPNSHREYVLKFEAKVKKWYGGYLNLCLSTPDHAGSNQEIWSNSLNARAIWGPWAEENEEFSTGEDWITVVVPMTAFQYSMGTEGSTVVYTPGQEFIETNVGSFSTWMLGSPENTGNAVEFYIDNIRFVEL